MAILANARETALTPSSHLGSAICVPSDSVDVGVIVVLQSIVTAIMLKVLAIGPNVPAIEGNNVDTIHQCIGALKSITVSSSSFRAYS